MGNSRRTIGFLVLEFLVIFMGIVSSFIFEEWREARQRVERKQEILLSMLSSIPTERRFIQFPDSVISDQLVIIDSINNDLNPSSRTIADFIKRNVSYSKTPILDHRLSDWRLFVNPNDSEMIKIRGLLKNKRLPLSIEAYLSISDGISFDREVDLRSELSNEIMKDLYVSWGITNNLFREEGITTGDMYIGDIVLRGDYKSLLKKKSFKKKVTEIGIQLREQRRTFTLMEQLYLDRIEKALEAELNLN